MMKVFSMYYLLCAFIVHANNVCYDKIETMQSIDSAIVYAECHGSTHATLYSSNYPDVLFYVKIANSGAHIVDSIIDFNHGFTKYEDMKRFKQAMGEIYSKHPTENLVTYLSYASARKYQLKNPLLGGVNDSLYIVDDKGIYSLSIHKREFKRIVSYHHAMDLQNNCSENDMVRLSNPNKSISSSGIKIVFLDSSSILLTSNESPKINVVDSNSCLLFNGTFNNIHIDRIEGGGCKKNVVCE